MFLLIYTFLSKLFPMVSMWETRESGTVEVEAEEKVERTVHAIHAHPSIASVVRVVLLIASITIAAMPGRAADSPAAPQLKPTVLTMQWELQPQAGQPAGSPGTTGSGTSGSSRAYEYLKDLYSPLLSSPKEKRVEEPSSVVKVTATLVDDKGAPITYQAVGFALKTSFGTLLQFGKVPTDGQGKAKLVLHDRRCGVYPFQSVYGGDQTFRTSYAESKVDFGPCPAAGLPAVGVLITPYATAPITLSFAFFYGTIWVSFFYAFGYLLFWKMRRAGKNSGLANVPGH
jgi:hypothetical protein